MVSQSICWASSDTAIYTNKLLTFADLAKKVQNIWLKFATRTTMLTGNQTLSKTSGSKV